MSTFQQSTKKKQIKTPFARSKSYFIHIPSGTVSDRVLDLIKEDLEIDRLSLAWFLALGFVPGEKTLFKDIACLPGGADIDIYPGRYIVKNRFRYHDLVKDDLQELSESKLIELGLSKWRSVISKLYEKNNKDIVVPISGGLDSRAILSALLENVEAKKINTYTFGRPGYPDYEISKLIAAEVGTNHTLYDLNEYEYTKEKLEEVADLANLNVEFIQHAPYDWIRRDFGDSASYWMGYLGGPVTGSHVPDISKLHEWGNKYCLEWGRKEKGVKLESFLSNFSSDLFADLQDYPTLESVTKEELWDLENRQERWLSSSVLLRGFNYVLPFADKEWLGYTLSVSSKFRKEQYLYKKILSQGFPKLFSLPNNSHSRFSSSLFLEQTPKLSKFTSRFLRKIKKIFAFNTSNINSSSSSFVKGGKYIDFNVAFRGNEFLHNEATYLQCNSSLNKYLSQESVSSLVREHFEQTYNRKEALMILTSLSIIIRLVEMKNVRNPK